MPTTIRTKIVCTLGPSTEDDDILRAMIEGGMDVARLNFSHGSHDDHRRNIGRVRRIASELGANVAVMVDTKGPEIRTRLNRDHQPVELRKGDRVVLTSRDVESEPGLIAFDLPTLTAQVEPGSTIFVDDGLIQLVVDHVEDGTEIICTAANNGSVWERKGINVPGIHTGLPAVTEQDRTDILFSCAEGADAIAASFICDADAVREIRSLCEGAGRPDMMIIAKIESQLALENLEEIIDASDGIMVARGDLGVEIPPFKVPMVQKRIIDLCNRAYKPVITATQMLESMRNVPRPTRAEVTDVANAVYDGTDCVMLSGETAAGSYPVEAVSMMSKVCEGAEETLRGRMPRRHGGRDDISAVTSYYAVRMAERVEAAAIACPTSTGRSARIMAAQRPPIPIIAVMPHADTVRKSCFYWGVVGIKTDLKDGLDTICYNALKIARRSGFVKKDDLVVVTAGDAVTSPITDGPGISTNTCMITQVF